MDDKCWGLSRRCCAAQSEHPALVQLGQCPGVGACQLDEQERFAAKCMEFDEIVFWVPLEVVLPAITLIAEQHLCRYIGRALFLH